MSRKGLDVGALGPRRALRRARAGHRRAPRGERRRGHRAHPRAAPPRALRVPRARRPRPRRRAPARRGRHPRRRAHGRHRQPRRAAPRAHPAAAHRGARAGGLRAHRAHRHRPRRGAADAPAGRARGGRAARPPPGVPGHPDHLRRRGARPHRRPLGGPARARRERGARWRSRPSRGCSPSAPRASAPRSTARSGWTSRACTSPTRCSPTSPRRSPRRCAPSSTPMSRSAKRSGPSTRPWTTSRGRAGPTPVAQLRASREATVTLVSCGVLYSPRHGPLVPRTGMLQGLHVTAANGALTLRRGDDPGGGAPPRAPPTRWPGSTSAGSSPWAWPRRETSTPRASRAAWPASCACRRAFTRSASGTSPTRSPRASRAPGWCASRGPSSSGKTTFLKRLSVQLQVAGINPVGLSLDDYYVDRAKHAA